MERTMGTLQLIALGVAVIVGAGIFVLTGQAAANYAGPAIVISFALAGIAAVLAALCYVELTGAIPVTGSAYTFSFVALGSAIGWFVGWNLILEYLLGAATVAVGWSGYFENALERVGVELPSALAAGPFDGGAVNLPAALLIVGVTSLLIVGVRESARATTGLVAVKVGVLLLFVGFGAFYISVANYQPFVPANEGSFGAFGASGVARATGVVFFAYIGFDVVCAAVQEVRNPRRSVPMGILGAVAVATLLYVTVGAVMTGIASYTLLDVPDPLSVALDGVSQLEWLQAVIDLGAILFLAAGVLALIYGQARIFMRMALDGMLPDRFGRTEAAHGTPVSATLITASLAAVCAAFLPLDVLANLISVGTLTAFALIAAAVIVLRRREPSLERPIRLPFGDAIPIMTIMTTVAITFTLPLAALARFVIWAAIGAAIFFAYSRPRVERVVDERLARRSD